MLAPQGIHRADIIVNSAVFRPAPAGSTAAGRSSRNASGSLTLILTPPPVPRARSAAPRNSARARRRWRCEAQYSLPISLPAQAITPLMQRVLDVVQRLAAARQPMLGNTKLGQLLTGGGRQSVAKALDKLAAVRLVKIETRRGARRIHVCATGAVTDWGEHRAGHAPFCAVRRMEAEGIQPKPVIESLKKGEGFLFLGINEQELRIYQHALGSISHSAVGSLPTCGFIDDDDFPCGSRSLPGKSWCAAHHAIVYAKKTTK